MRVPAVAADQIGWLTESEMVDVDRVMIEDLHIELIQMMENAGRNLAELALQRYSPNSVVVLAGSGGNGGGGMVAARHLANRGVDVRVLLTRLAGDVTGVPGHQLDVLHRMGVPIADSADAMPSLIIDSVIGYSLRGAPQGRAAELIAWANGAPVPVLSLDTPSGLNVTDGSTPGDVVRADATMTLALPKIGLRSATEVGELFVADISVPLSVYAAMNAGPPPDFATSTILHIHTRATF